jgi:hypothetical protein
MSRSRVENVFKMRVCTCFFDSPQWHNPHHTRTYWLRCPEARLRFRLSHPGFVYLHLSCNTGGLAIATANPTLEPVMPVVIDALHTHDWGLENGTCRL